MSTVVKILVFLFFGPAERVKVFNKIAVLLENKLSLDTALSLLYDHAKEIHHPHEEIFEYIIKKTAEGLTFGQALTGIATQEEISLIEAAQISGRISQGLRFAAKVMDAKMKIKKSLIQNLTNPFFMFAACIAMLVLISFKVIPQLAMIADPKDWEGANWLLYIMCDFVASTWGLLCAVFLCILTVLIFLSFPRLTGPLRRVLDKKVPWSIYRMTVGTGWLYTIAIRMSAGHPLANILKTMQEYTTPYLREIVGAIYEHSQHGENFGLALQASKMNFPSKDIVNELRIYAMTPNFQKDLMSMAETWLEQGVEEVQRLAGKIGNFVYILIILQVSLVAFVASNFQSQVNMGGM